MLSSIWQANLLISALDSSEVTTHTDTSHHLREITHFHLIHFLAQCLRNDKMQACITPGGVTLMGYDNGMESFLNTATLLNCRHRKPMNGLGQFHTPAERKYNKQTTLALNDLGNIIFCHSRSKIHVRIFLPTDLWKNRHWGGNKNKEAVRWSECRVNTWSGVFSLSYDRWLWVISVATKVLWDGETYYCLKTLIKSFCTLWDLQKGTFLQSETVQTSLCCVRQFDSCLTAGTCYL